MEEGAQQRPKSENYSDYPNELKKKIETQNFLRRSLLSIGKTDEGPMSSTESVIDTYET